MAASSKKRKAESPQDLTIMQKAMEQLSIADQPRRSMDEETKNWIDIHCPGWNDEAVKKTYMIPSVFPDNGNLDDGKLAERQIYDILKHFGDETEQPMFVVHAYEFHELVEYLREGPRVKSKKWMRGEHDFVIIHRTCGIVFLQVKAAVDTAKYKEGKDQLRKDTASLTREFKDISFNKEGKKNTKKVKIEVEKEMKTQYPGFVVMPNCPRPPSDQTGHKKTGCFKEDCATLADFKKWWEENIPQRSDEFTMYEQMAIRFVGPAVTLLQMEFDGTAERLYQLTMEQLNYYMNDTPKQYITGPAGSGKTWLLVQKAQEVAKSSPNQKILILCYNKPLSLYLENEFPEGEYTNVRIITLWSLLCKIKRPKKALSELSLADKKALVYDCVDELNDSSKSQVCRIFVSEHVFVDEAQDMYEGWWKLVDALHKNSKTEKRYKWVFLDKNQVVYNRGMPTTSIPPEILTDAKKMNTIIRNTHRIFECSKKFLTALCGAKLGHSVRGPDVKWIDRLSGNQGDHLFEGARLVKEEVRDLKRKQVAMSDIVVLARNQKESDLLKDHLSQESKDIETQDAEEAIKYPKRSAITVDSIRRFKGLERKVVILVDPPFDDESESEKGLTYVGMSRSFCLLVIVTTKKFKEKYGIESQQDHVSEQIPSQVSVFETL